MKDVYALLLPVLLPHVVIGVHILPSPVGEVLLSNTDQGSNEIGSNGGGNSTPLQKVLLTQKGYIQFLRWDVPVPNINEFTFCLWFLSTNLTHSHSILSYSKNERERLIRSWISPKGESVHMEIGGQEVFKESARIEENRWYHICQSWESRLSRYALWIDGRIITQGQHYATRGHVVPGGGDFVLGQEYTDFDSGLEDGIEGAVLGFNVLLASAFPSSDSREDDITGKRHSYESNMSYYVTLPSYAGDGSLPQPLYIAPPFQFTQHRLEVYKNHRRRRRFQQSGKESTYVEGTVRNDPFGLQLVKLSYVRCELGRASPRVGGPFMLISWSRTPMRVFGGAIVKNARNECGHF